MSVGLAIERLVLGGRPRGRRGAGARARRRRTSSARTSCRAMQPGAVLVDISIDQGGCFETSHVTTHSDPTYVVHGVVHYCVGNMPGAVPRTSTYALTNVTLPYALAIATHGLEDAVRADPALALGVNVYGGQHHERRRRGGPRARRRSPLADARRRARMTEGPAAAADALRTGRRAVPRPPHRRTRASRRTPSPPTAAISAGTRLPRARGAHATPRRRATRPSAPFVASLSASTYGDGRAALPGQRPSRARCRRCAPSTGSCCARA